MKTPVCTDAHPCEECTRLSDNKARYDLIVTLRNNLPKMGNEGRLFAEKLIKHLETLIDDNLDIVTKLMKARRG
jgi:hypothetical protein